MPAGGEQPAEHEEILQDLRTILGPPVPGAEDFRRARERMSGRACAYARRYLLTRHFRKRFGFSEEFSTVVAGVADLVVAELLAEIPIDARRCPALEREISGAGDQPLFCFYRTLRGRAQMGLTSAWKDEHPAKASLLRCLKSHAARHPTLRIETEARGQLLIGPGSDLALDPLARSDLLRIFRTPTADPARILEALLPHLEPSGRSGGYLFLMDAVLAIEERLVMELDGERDPAGAPGPDGITGAILPGLPDSLLRARVRACLESLAREILARERHRDRRGSAEEEPPPNAAEAAAVIEPAVEVVARDYALGEADLEGLSLAGLLDRAAGPAPETERAAREGRAWYLVRRIRERWEGRTP